MRFAFASLAAVAGCVTPPPPLPPRRVMFPDPPQAPLPRPADLPLATEPPIEHDRYGHFTLLGDSAAAVPLARWLGRSDDYHYAVPILLTTPLIHLAHGQVEQAAISLGMRGAMLGALHFSLESAEAECRSSDSLICIPIGSIAIATLAFTTVVIVDSAILARRAKPKAAWRRLPLQPAFATGADGRRVFSLGGRF